MDRVSKIVLRRQEAFGIDVPFNQQPFRARSLDTFYDSHSRFAARSQGDIRHLSRAARAVQPLRVPLPRNNVAAARSQSMSHEIACLLLVDGRSDDGSKYHFRKEQVGMGFSSQAAGSRDHDLALTRREPEDPRPRGHTGNFKHRTNGAQYSPTSSSPTSDGITFKFPHRTPGAPSYSTSLTV